MKAVVLASGSGGNATFLKTNSSKILIDIGKNAKYITDKLKSIQEDPSEIDGIIISHTHKDHVSALEVFIHKYHPNVYVTEKMLYDLEYLRGYDHVVIYDDDFYINDTLIKTIKTSHDVTDSRNFVIHSDNESLVYLTDTGYLNRKYFPILKDCNYYLMESNHDIEMLLNGPYPKWLKQRVLGTQGHLSNKDSSFYLTKLIGENTKKVILMHLSEHNNTEEKALSTLEDTLKEYDIAFTNFMCAKPDEITEVCNDQNIMCR